MIRLRVLGAVEVKRSPEGVGEGSLSQPKRVALLCYLALGGRRGPVRRDTVLALLWPELDEDHARRALSQALYQIGKTLDRDLIASRGHDELRLVPGMLSCDAVEVLEALERGDLREALTRCDGELLPGFHVDGSPHFDRWMDEQRADFRSRLVEASLSLAESAAVEGRVDEAARWARTALGWAPYAEVVLRRVLRILGRIGDRAQAIRTYEAAARMMSEDLELELSPETVAVMEEIGRREGGSARAIRSEPVRALRALPAAAVAKAAYRVVGGSDPRPPPWKIPRRPAGLAVITFFAAWGAFTLQESGRTADTASVGSADRYPEPTPVAVLPLLDLNGDAENAYFADGLTEELITALGRAPRLRVAAPSSTFALTRKDLPIREIARQLAVDYVLEGSVLRAADSIRIAVHLIRGIDGHRVWTETYDRPLDDVFAVQQEISRAVTAALSLRPDTTTPLSERIPGDRLAAWDFYLRGRYHWNRRTPEGLVEARTQLEQAVRRDPSFAPAYAALAATWAVLPDYTDVATSDALPAAREAAEQALRLDGTLAEAYAVLGHVYERSHRPEDAGRAYRQALALNPSLATAHHWYAYHLVIQGRLSEAVAEIFLARELDPLSVVTRESAAWILYFARRWSEAVEQAESALELDPSYVPAHLTIALTRLHQGRMEDAVARAEHALGLSGTHSSRELALVGYVYGSAGDARAETILRQIQARQADGHASRLGLALTYLGLGDRESALTLLEEAVRNREPFVPATLRSDASLDPLRAEPRFIRLLEALGRAQ